jgi:hypothetical protein
MMDSGVNNSDDKKDKHETTTSTTTNNNDKKSSKVDSIWITMFCINYANMIHVCRHSMSTND